MCLYLIVLQSWFLRVGGTNCMHTPIWYLGPKISTQNEIVTAQIGIAFGILKYLTKFLLIFLGKMNDYNVYHFYGEMKIDLISFGTVFKIVTN